MIDSMVTITDHRGNKHEKYFASDVALRSYLAGMTDAQELHPKQWAVSQGVPTPEVIG